MTRFLLRGVGIWIPGSIVKDTGFLGDVFFLQEGLTSFHFVRFFFVLIGGSNPPKTNIFQASMTFGVGRASREQSFKGGSIHRIIDPGLQPKMSLGKGPVVFSPPGRRAEKTTSDEVVGFQYIERRFN